MHTRHSITTTPNTGNDLPNYASVREIRILSFPLQTDKEIGSNLIRSNTQDSRWRSAGNDTRTKKKDN